jgi:hypothetical protein
MNISLTQFIGATGAKNTKSTPLLSALRLLKSSDWEQNIVGCELLSRIAEDSPALHTALVKTAIFDLEPLVDSLRSKIAMAAIDTVAIIFKNLDPSLFNKTVTSCIMHTLFKRAAGIEEFIALEA